jgi:mRNA interferase RelE/StbE
VKTIVLTHRAAKDLDSLPTDARHSLSEALIAYAVDGQGDVRKLAGRNGFRMRVGRYRVIFDDDGATILAIYFGKRESTTYKRN